MESGSLYSKTEKGVALPTSHLIAGVHFDFNVQDERFARDINARWESFFMKHLESIADEVLTQYDIPGEVLEIDRLDLDLRVLREEDFDRRFPAAFREQLEEELIKCIYYNRNKPVSTSTKSAVSSVTQYAFGILCHFLLRGTLPLTANSRYRDMQALFLEALRENSARLKRFLFAYGHYTSLQERLVYQFRDPLLEDTVRLMEPEAGEFIVAYVHLLRARYKDVAQPGIHETGYRHSVWFVVYAYLLHNTGSRFSRRNFVMQTIIRLGAKYNIAYEQLLDLITRELEQFAQSAVIDPELFEILKYLRRQSDEKRLQQSSVSGAKFYKELFKVLQQDINKGFTAENRLHILQILARPDLCRLFLQQLNEDEIAGLVPVVLPNDCHFVIATARSLDLQKDRGTLQGKAGNEFRLIKWQVIFSLLLHEKKVAFNRHYFVAASLREIAAHYNLDWRDLLDFFLSDPLLREKIDKELLFVLTDLQKKFADKQVPHITPVTTSSEPSPDTNTPPPYASQDSEASHAPQASDDNALLSHASQAPEDNSLLSHIPPSPDNYAPLSHVPQAAIDSSHLSHSSQASADKALLSHISPSTDDNALLSHILQTLKQDKAFTAAEQRYLLQKTGDNRFRRILLDKTTEAEQIKLIQILFPENREYIVSYAQKLDLLHDFNQIAGKTPGGFIRIKWDFLFAVLSGIEDKSFNRLNFIGRTLQQIAAHYNTTTLDLLYYFRQEDINARLPYQLKKWLDELYTKETALRLKTAAPQSIKTEPNNSVAPAASTLETSTANNPTNNFPTSAIPPSDNPAPAIQASVSETPISGVPTDEAPDISVSDNSVDVFSTPAFATIGNPAEEPSVIILSEAKTDREKELAGKLLLQKDFIQYTGSLLRLIPPIRRFFTDELKKELPAEQLYKFLLGLSSVYKTLSITDMLIRFIEWLQKSIPAEKQATFYANAENWSDRHTILNSVLYKNNANLKNKHTNTPQAIETMETNQSTHINNAGIALTAPFLQVLFGRLKFLGDDRKFKGKEEQVKAIYLVQYTAFDSTDFPEHELVLNKILVGLDVNEAIPPAIELSEQEKTTCREMLESIKTHWDKMKGTSIEGLQLSFLQRPGNLEEKEDHYQLTVEEKAYDILLDTLPWNFRIIKFPWMPKRIDVKWR